MSLKSFFIKPYAAALASNVGKWSLRAIEDQKNCLNTLLIQAGQTDFGKAHGFSKIKDYAGFKANVPLRNYEDFNPWLEKVFNGEKNVLWPGLPIYFAKSSGTTSGVKYIPISRDSISHHFFSAQAASLLYMQKTKSYKMMDGKMLFLSGSPELHIENGIPTGRLSGIVNHHIPNYLSKNKLPNYETNCIADWEKKLDRIVEESLAMDVSLIGGIPPWIQMYFDKLIEKSGKSIAELYPNLKLLVHGGVNFTPYQKRMLDSIGKEIDMIETYPASEGFIAFQDDFESEGLLLNTKAGMFYEFVPANEILDKNPTRLSLEEVELGCQYAVVLSSNAGLWAYALGDTVRFLSLNPFKIKVTGRINHQLSAFGEHVIAEEVEQAISSACQKFNVSIEEFTVAPNLGDQQNKGFHEWIVATRNTSIDKAAFAHFLNEEMCRLNIYYKDLIEGNVIQKLKLRWVDSKIFHQGMKKLGKLGGQNKSPRLMNDRTFADILIRELAQE